MESSEKAYEQLEEACKTMDLVGVGAGDAGLTNSFPFNSCVSDDLISDSSWWISLSIATTSFMIGRSFGRELTHKNETASVWSISCIWGSALPLSFGSRISTGSFFSCKWSLTHCTKCVPPGKLGSSGCLPVSTSNRTTPKLYTSLFSVIRCADPCSAVIMYNIIVQINNQQKIRGRRV